MPGSRSQCCADGEPERYLELFRLGDLRRRTARAELAERATGIEDDPATIIDAVELALP